MSMSHEEYRNLVPVHLSGHLDPTDGERFLEHGQHCPRCAEHLRQEKELWETLALADPDSLGKRASVWPEVRRRTLGAGKTSVWFFGQGRLSRTGWAACALAVGLIGGWGMPTWLGTAGSAGVESSAYVAQSSWLDDSSAYDLAGLWLDMGTAEEGDGS